MRARARLRPLRSDVVPGGPLDAHGTRLHEAVLLGQAERLGRAQDQRLTRPGRIRHGCLTGQGAAGGRAADRPLMEAVRAWMVLACRGAPVAVRSVLAVRLDGRIRGQAEAVGHSRVPLVGVRVGLRRGVVGSGVPLHRARRRRGDGHGHRQHGEQHCAKNCQGPSDPFEATTTLARTDLPGNALVRPLSAERSKLFLGSFGAVFPSPKSGRRDESSTVKFGVTSSLMPACNAQARAVSEQAFA